ncbi:hypothetical protein [Asticcacaulis sp. YBE204]|uniref:hypothetical protein n=1 Tax=Asticcacaulis sp. YBE204 TaxID=1282363 RepID=UPI0003C3E468|nr:hypothetical protein [Asticcacaulis sp. YBE204]ESQ80526.1 hypothetical protein AEYBE204_04465 [Asticcacaulis sp. YBE204]
MWKLDRKVLGVAGAAVLGLGVLALVPQVSDAQDAAPPSEKVRRCVNGPGLDTHVLDEETLLVQDNGRSGLVVKVDGCRLNPHDILVFEWHGTQQICDPVDIQLSVRSTGGFRSHCFVQSVTPVGAAEAKVLAKQEFKRKAS